MDNVHAVFESILDYSQFSVRVAQADIAKLPAILQSIPAGKVLQMQKALARVWHRFAYKGELHCACHWASSGIWWWLLCRACFLGHCLGKR